MLFAPAERGQGLVEYAMILILVSIFVVVLVSLIGPQVGYIFSNVITLI
jgi:pilus assembly protein Flp/PilA